MNKPISLSAIFQASQPTISIEFFPPKTEEGARQILKTAQALKDYGISFASITYGAGGSTRERTLEYGELLQQLFGYQVVPHLTCVGHSQDELTAVIDRIATADFPGIVALRGDPPKGEATFQPHPDGLRHASDLVHFIRKQQGKKLAIGVAAYPEKHPEAADLATDLHWLKHKVDQGADFIVTQLFFDNAHYFSFVKQCRALGITVPILPGILPPLSLEQAKKFVGFCGAHLPAALEEKLAACGDDLVAAQTAGIDWAFSQIQELLAHGAPGFHLYILNRSESALALLDSLRAAGTIHQ